MNKPIRVNNLVYVVLFVCDSSRGNILHVILRPIYRKWRRALEGFRPKQFEETLAVKSFRDTSQLVRGGLLGIFRSENFES